MRERIMSEFVDFVDDNFDMVSDYYVDAEKVTSLSLISDNTDYFGDDADTSIPVQTLLADNHLADLVIEWAKEHEMEVKYLWNKATIQSRLEDVTGDNKAKLSDILKQLENAEQIDDNMTIEKIWNEQYDLQKVMDKKRWEEFERMNG